MRRLIEDAKRLRRAAVPLFRLDQRRRAVQYGSATCLRYKGKRFICTARHCLEEESPAYVQGRSRNFIPLNLLFCAVPNYDVAVAALPDEFVTEMNVGGFIGLRGVRLIDPGAPFYLGAAFGWPATKSRSIRGTPDVEITPMTICNALEFGWPSVLLTFEKKNMEFLDGRVSTAPDPNGMSGGPIFSHPIGVPAKTELCGIGTRWNSPKRQIEGTDIRVVLKAIEDVLLGQPGALPAA